MWENHSKWNKYILYAGLSLSLLAVGKKGYFSIMPSLLFSIQWKWMLILSLELQKQKHH